ncbi:NAD(P)-binding protein [Lindgomyces ingoldianus]|uniref:NAD(P)-binding protein n=1 Tax=Lindgomyces ingoldianus TaxID=673940 RepID=A0ACB6QST2_9PLEO|nr:NAD(P)-binding protein [Lindgomyces ingoldianus]KAF2469996.1 NAD(P)-binding protein [Lindgomyces ingoldianus]
MITVAVAGGTSPAVGRAILVGLKQYPEQLKPVVLGRVTSETPKWLLDMGIEVRKVDYSSEDSLISALRDVHTVICTLLAKDGTWASTQINLLNASLKAGVSRFAPAEFGCGALAAPKVALLSPQIAVIDACREAKRLHPEFEYAGFHVGLFMNYLAYGGPNELEALNGLNDRVEFIWHIKDMRAEIPLTKDGDIPRMTFTEIGDVGRMTAAACLLSKGEWQEDFGMEGETARMDEVVRVIETVSGGKMTVTFKPFEQVVREKNEETDPYKKFWKELEMMCARDVIGEGIVAPILNEVLKKSGLNVQPPNSIKDWCMNIFKISAGG